MKPSLGIDQVAYSEEPQADGANKLQSGDRGRHFGGLANQTEIDR